MNATAQINTTVHYCRDCDAQRIFEILEHDEAAYRATAQCIVCDLKTPLNMG